MNNQEGINQLIDAITTSGKKFKEIPKETIFNFFKKIGIDKNEWNSLYSTASEYFYPKSTKPTVNGDTQQHFNKNIDYYSSSLNDVKKRIPKKNVIGEITKIS